MAHEHLVTDSDKNFIIDPISRKITNQSESKVNLIQYDHNSERFSFQLPLKIEGHEMEKCNVIQVHYINVNSQTKESNSGVYEVNDLNEILVSDMIDGIEKFENVLSFTWLISHNATQHVGPLNFLIRFACVDENTGELEYVWNTGIFEGITVSNGMYNGEMIVEEYADILEQWKHELYSIDDSVYSDSTTWSSNKIADNLHVDIAASGDIVECTPVIGLPLIITSDITVSQNDIPSANNIIPLVGFDSLVLTITDKDNPENIETYMRELPEMVYGGAFEWNTGKLTITHAYISAYNGESLPGEWLSDRDVYEENTAPSIGAEVIYLLNEPRIIYLESESIIASMRVCFTESNCGKTTAICKTLKYLSTSGGGMNGTLYVGSDQKTDYVPILFRRSTSDGTKLNLEESVSISKYGNLSYRENGTEKNHMRLHAGKTVFMQPVTVESGGHGGKTAAEARKNLGVVGTNLLDNSYFANPVNQRGETSYSSGLAYCIDRWLFDVNITCAIVDTHIALTNSAIDARYGFIQYVNDIGDKSIGKTYTACVELADGVKYCASMTVPETVDTYGEGKLNGEFVSRLGVDSNNRLVFKLMIPADFTINIVNVALYEGVYKAESAPEYVYKGYATELNECMRYYIRMPADSALSFSGYAHNASTARFTFPLPVIMRTKTPNVTFTWRTNVKIYPNDITPNSIDSATISGTNCCIVMTCSGLTANSMLFCKPNAIIQLSCDL